MASISKRDNGSWLARYRPTPGGPQVAKTFARKTDGQRWLDEQVAGLVRGDHVDHRSGHVTLRDYATNWALRSSPWVLGDRVGVRHAALS